MLDLLYVNRAYALASHILSYYHDCSQLAPHERYVRPIDTNARLVNMLVVLIILNSGGYLIGSYTCLLSLFVSSGGMNGYLWLCERNVFSSVVSSPIRGLQDVECNQVL